ncbi:glutathione peroxidase [Alicyclobacillus sp. SO9]|uniref:glutathione peroxidase n=1 Tax=Alicyclobacillus sp. SO9 TaxID=2665646 RepID=UPI0018E73F76|nr:glutathione peroxidase [Alicyclobacillus sp. SO9]QQE80083.1 glutathione peroxidase [Alicyclobacillus sp. SO9]
MTVYDFAANRIDGSEQSLADYSGKVLLIVNTASKCGFTPQYEGLQAIYQSYRQQGFEILGFPCNQFGKQEPGNSTEIQEFCSLNYQVSFPMFEKIDVNGEEAHPLYRYLKSNAPGILGSERIKWNFTKFLVNRDGHVVKRYASAVKPADMGLDIEKLLKAGN